MWGRFVRWYLRIHCREMCAGLRYFRTKEHAHAEDFFEEFTGLADGELFE